MPSGAHILVDTTGARMAEAGGWVGGVGVNTPGFLYFHGPADAVGGGEVETKPISRLERRHHRDTESTERCISVF